MAGRTVRAEGLEPTRSFEQWHLKPSRLPFRHARKTTYFTGGVRPNMFTGALDRLDIPWTRSTKYAIAIHREAATARLDEFIGPKC